jgi:hypothetical protein
MRLVIIEILGIVGMVLLLVANISFYFAHLRIRNTDSYKSYSPDLQRILPKLSSIHEALEIADPKARSYFKISRVTMILGIVAIAVTMALMVFTTPDS